MYIKTVYICLSRVRFGDDLTVYIIDNEGRNGGWHHIIRAHQRFERRIVDLDQKLTQFLQPSHGAKALLNQTQAEV